VKVIFRIAEFNPDALNTVDLRPKRPFSVGECALWARLVGPRFAAQVVAVVSQVEAPYNFGKAISKLFAGKHSKPISKGAKAAAAEAAVTAAEAIAVADLEEANSLAAEFEAFGGGALTMALAQEAEPGDPFRECWIAHERIRVSEARSINRAEILTTRTDAAA
jgi:hypothetical protein